MSGPEQQPQVVSAMEASLASAPRTELECFTRTLLIAIHWRYGEGPTGGLPRTPGPCRPAHTKHAEVRHAPREAVSQ